MHPSIRERVESILFVDTHEHLLKESTRLAGPGAHRAQPCDDAALLFYHYTRDDLQSSGMSTEALSRFLSPDVDPGEKWPLVEDAWRRIRHTGYGRAVAETLRILFEVEDLNSANFIRVSEAIRQHARPGFYKRILRGFARVEACQVNSLEAPFCETEYPHLLQQDLSIVGLSTGVSPQVIADYAHLSGIRAETLADWHRVIDWFFQIYGPRADAVKSQAAYQRRLNYDPVPANSAAPLFQQMAQGNALDPQDRKSLEDHLMHQCITRACRAGLPIKLHCGYYAGSNNMPLERVRQNAADLCPLFIAYPEATFVLMHIGYPYQDEYIALAKHYQNVVIDLCWAWIINPAACVRFVKEFLMAAPSNKLLTFGGDYLTVENIVGHAAIARQGLAQALSELVDESWLTEGAALDLVEPLMRGNAHALFPIFQRELAPPR